MYITMSLASNVTNELVARWRTKERVKRLVSNKTELGMMILTIESRASNIPRWQREQRMLLCGLTDKDLCRICGSKYEHLGSAIGYWPERCLGHVYIVLEPIGSARLTFDDDFVLYELCELVTECCSESQMRSCNSWIPEEYLVCYQTSQRNRVIINMLYRYLRRCLLSWHRSRLGFVAPIVGEVSLGPLGNAHHYKPCKQCD